MKRYFAFTSTKSWASLLALLQRRLSNFICWARLSELIVGRSCSDELRSSQVNFPRTRRIKLSAFCLIMYLVTGTVQLQQTAFKTRIKWSILFNSMVVWYFCYMFWETILPIRNAFRMLENLIICVWENTGPTEAVSLVPNHIAIWLIYCESIWFKSHKEKSHIMLWLDLSLNVPVRTTK